MCAFALMWMLLIIPQIESQLNSDHREILMPPSYYATFNYCLILLKTDSNLT